ncbi:MAG: hypothetical protein MUF49_28195 [Oculatellaceae cyanobacterium Prado106]|nr:hypothetical protein [Oculatellaceae cyanobacterium Prado106]
MASPRSQSLVRHRLFSIPCLSPLVCHRLFVTAYSAPGESEAEGAQETFPLQVLQSQIQNRITS